MCLYTQGVGYKQKNYHVSLNCTTEHRRSVSNVEVHANGQHLMMQMSYKLSSLHMHFTNRCYGILYNKIQVDKILDLEDFEKFV